jgi:hypothetical protein
MHLETSKTPLVDYGHSVLSALPRPAFLSEFDMDTLYVRIYNERPSWAIWFEAFLSLAIEVTTGTVRLESALAGANGSIAVRTAV